MSGMSEAQKRLFKLKLKINQVSGRHRRWLMLGCWSLVVFMYSSQRSGQADERVETDYGTDFGVCVGIVVYRAGS